MIPNIKPPVCPVCKLRVGYRTCCPDCLRQASAMHWFFAKVLRVKQPETDYERWQAMRAAEVNR